jgi:hypothetical protein
MSSKRGGRAPTRGTRETRGRKTNAQRAAEEAEARENNATLLQFFPAAEKKGKTAAAASNERQNSSSSSTDNTENSKEVGEEKSGSRVRFDRYLDGMDALSVRHRRQFRLEFLNPRN